MANLLEPNKVDLAKEFIRAAVRPGITFGFLGVFAGAFFTGQIADLPEWFTTLGVASIAWWFASRQIEKIVE